MTIPTETRESSPSDVERAGDQRATSLELFFDLVYVFAFIQVAHLMATGASLMTVLGGVAVLGVLWWSWASHAWLTNQNIADRGVVRVGILIAVAIVLLLSISIPSVYPAPGESHFGALLFAVSFATNFCLVRRLRPPSPPVPVETCRRLIWTVPRSPPCFTLPGVG
jgi:low temperature requirement protein LtrA